MQLAYFVYENMFADFLGDDQRQEINLMLIFQIGMCRCYQHEKLLRV
jgi:hypothetical protein